MSELHKLVEEAWQIIGRIKDPALRDAAVRWHSDYTAYLNAEASTVCDCGHLRIRHVGCAQHKECCDEDDCTCHDFKTETPQ